MRLLLMSLFLFSSSLCAHEIQSTTQHISIKRQRKSAWQQDLSAKLTLNEKTQAGAQSTYLERFNQYEKRYGGFLIYRPTERWSLESHYLQGPGNQVLPQKQAQFTAYHSLTEGISPYVSYRDLRYSVTKLSLMSGGMEIEKVPHLIIAPSFLIGRATFKNPAQTKGVHNLGLRMIWYQENSYGFSVFASKGREASQGIIGQSAILVDTLTGGLSYYQFYRERLKAELVFDHTNYDQLKNQFLTTTLNLTWML